MRRMQHAGQSAAVFAIRHDTSFLERRAASHTCYRKSHHADARQRHDFSPAPIDLARGFMPSAMLTHTFCIIDEATRAR